MDFSSVGLSPENEIGDVFLASHAGRGWLFTGVSEFLRILHLCSMDRLTPEQRSFNMRSIRSSHTQMEQKLAEALWQNGLRYRRNNGTIPGNPDFAFRSLRVAVFVDGEFFHGKDWETQKYRIKSRREFWWPKIERNMRRDEEVNRLLSEQGWIILRFWSQEIRKNLRDCLLKVEQAISERKHANEVLRNKKKAED